MPERLAQLPRKAKVLILLEIKSFRYLPTSLLGQQKLEFRHFSGRAQQCTSCPSQNADKLPKPACQPHIVRSIPSERLDQQSR